MAECCEMLQNRNGDAPTTNRKPNVEKGKRDEI